MRFRPLFAIALGISLVAPHGDAAAATAQVECRGDRFCGIHVVVYRAAAGEANDVTVAPIAGTFDFRLRDAGAPLTAGPGCDQIESHDVVCRRVSGHVEAALGDGDDSFVSSGTLGGSVDAGRGDDRVGSTGRLDGGPGDDVLDGGRGSDELIGGGGRDTLRGGPGSDGLVDGDSTVAPDPDLLDGGPGCDSVSYGGRRGSVVVDLVRGRRFGERGEGDIVRGVEGAAGGARADRLVGRRCATSGAALAGGKGDDVIVGTAGADTVFPGAGADRVDSRSGDDVIRLWEDGGRRARDSIRCGAGSDTLVGIERPDVASATCERHRELGPFRNAWFHGVVRGGDPVFGGSVECFGGRPCRVDVRIVARRSAHRGAPAPGEVLAEQRVAFRRGPLRMALRLSRAGLRAVRLSTTLPVRVQVTWTRREIGAVNRRQTFETELLAG